VLAFSGFSLRVALRAAIKILRHQIASRPVLDVDAEIFLRSVEAVGLRARQLNGAWN
jgi:hypothetical protein